MLTRTDAFLEESSLKEVINIFPKFGKNTYCSVGPNGHNKVIAEEMEQKVRRVMLHWWPQRGCNGQGPSRSNSCSSSSDFLRFTEYSCPQQMEKKII